MAFFQVSTTKEGEEDVLRVRTSSDAPESGIEVRYSKGHTAYFAHCTLVPTAHTPLFLQRVPIAQGVEKRPGCAVLKFTPNFPGMLYCAGPRPISPKAHEVPVVYFTWNPQEQVLRFQTQKDEEATNLLSLLLSEADHATFQAEHKKLRKADLELQLTGLTEEIVLIQGNIQKLASTKGTKEATLEACIEAKERIAKELAEL